MVAGIVVSVNGASIRVSPILFLSPSCIISGSSASRSWPR
jgi:hypothetical protein